MSAYYGETNDAAREVGGQTKYDPMGAAMLGTMPDMPIAELRSAIERANSIHENMMDMCGSLGRHLDRIMGSRPESNEASCLAGAIIAWGLSIDVCP